METVKSALLWAATTGLRDAIGLAGAGLIVFGVHMMHPAIGFITAGSMLVAVAVAAARKSAS